MVGIVAASRGRGFPRFGKGGERPPGALLCDDRFLTTESAEPQRVSMVGKKSGNFPMVGTVFSNAWKMGCGLFSGAEAVEDDEGLRLDAVVGAFAFEEAVGGDEVGVERGEAQEVVAVGIFYGDFGFVALCAAGEGAGDLSEGFVGADADLSVKHGDAAFPAGVGGLVEVFEEVPELFDGEAGGFDDGFVGGDDVGEGPFVVAEESFDGELSGLEAVANGLIGWIFFHGGSLD